MLQQSDIHLQLDIIRTERTINNNLTILTQNGKTIFIGI